MPSGRTKDAKSPRRRARAQSADVEPLADYPYTFAPVVQRKENRDALHYSLEVRQQPARARMVGSGEKADRRPIDPPPVVRLSINDSSRATPDQILLQSPYYFCFATLTSSELPEQELTVLPTTGKPYLVGSVVSSLFHLRDPDTSGFSAFFVWPDLGVRIEGTFRLKLSMYEIVGGRLYHCASVTTDRFCVFSAKRFPGMDGSTNLSRAFADQGIRLRVRSKLPHKAAKRRKPESPNSAQAWRTVQDDSGHGATREYPDALASVYGTSSSRGDCRPNESPICDEAPAKRIRAESNYDTQPEQPLRLRRELNIDKPISSPRSHATAPPLRSPTGTSLPSLSSMLYGAPADPSPNASYPTSAFTSRSRHNQSLHNNPRFSYNAEPDFGHDPHVRPPYFMRDAPLSPHLQDLSNPHGPAETKTFASSSIAERASSQRNSEYVAGPSGYEAADAQERSLIHKWDRADSSQSRKRAGPHQHSEFR